VIRAARETDATAICAVWNPIIRDTAITFNSVEKTATEIAGTIAQKRQDGHGFWVAQAADGQLDGFATYGQFRGGAGYARTVEHTVILGAPARGRGTGRALLETLEDHARRSGAHQILAGISGENPGGIAFHAAMGYRPVVVLPEVGWKFGRFMDLHLMVKRLSPLAG